MYFFVPCLLRDSENEEYERVLISVVEVYERVGKSVTSSCKNAQTG